MSTDGPIRLSLWELEAYRNQGSGRPSGRFLRFYCPIHGSDNQRSLSLNPETGYFHCFVCGAWSYVEGKSSSFLRKVINWIRSNDIH